MENMKVINRLLSMLDQQLYNCIQSGATFSASRRMNCATGGDEEQNAYYKGHFNMAEALIMTLSPNAYVAIDGCGKHSVCGL